MVDTDISSIAGTTMGIMGMGIGLGALAYTARAVTDTMYGQRYGPRHAPARKVAQVRRQARVRYSYPPRKPAMYRNYWLK